MNPFEMVVIIVAIVALAGVIKSKHARSHPSAEAADDEPAAAADSSRLRDEVRALKERIAVLERIATDRTAGLDHEIERLRDR